jgi:hypothetical protein
LTLSRPRITSVTKASWERAKNSPQLQKCPKCNGGFIPGLVIVTKKSTKILWYHKDCAKELNII